MLLDVTLHCPKGERCETCGASEDLGVETVHTPVGVLCTTLCGTCVEAGLVPEIRSFVVAYERIADHCVHLGIDVDQAAALLEASER